MLVLCGRYDPRQSSIPTQKASPGPAAHGYPELVHNLSKNDRFPNMDNYMDIIPGLLQG
jgi:hypothetical protein